MRNLGSRISFQKRQTAGYLLQQIVSPHEDRPIVAYPVLDLQKRKLGVDLLPEG
jgi:hypothetical protein|tara:strand:+ start:2313 stop:2474 length:162 start_codon:yes stop_codon:yes gene_type:complete